ncbi:MAG: tetratricopeptide repeat protein, partial [Candidatus Zixiibacteriota bacterium]
MKKNINIKTFTILIVVLFSIVSISRLNSQEVKPVIANALEKGDTTLAIDLLQKEIELDKSYHLNYYTLGMIYFERKQYNQALEQFDIALEKKSKHFESMYQLGLCYLNLGDLDKAEDIMEKGKKKDKKNKHRFEDGYGQVMLAKENWQEADRAFRQALINNPGNAVYHIHLGDANFYQGIPSLAIIEYEKALEVDTASLEVYYHWAEACLEMKDFTCAIEKLKIVLTKDSTYANAWMRAGGIYFKAARSSRSRQERTDRFKETIGAYKRYLELSGAQPDSSNVRVFFELAMSYVNLYGFEDAGEYFEKVLSIPIEPKDIYFYYGKSLWGIKDYVKSTEMLLKHIEWVKNQNDSYNSIVKEYELYQLLGDGYYYRDPKDFASAIEYYKKSLDIKSEQKRIVQNVAVAYHSLKSYIQALEYYQKRIEFGIDTISASIYKNAGYCALNIANNSGDEEDEDIDEEDEDTPSSGRINPD